METENTPSNEKEMIGKQIGCDYNYFASNHQSLSNYRTKFFIPAIGVTAKNERTDLNWQDSEGNTILHNMAKNNAQIDVIKKVHEMGGKIDIKNNQNKTPIDIADENGNLEIVAHLISAKFDEDKTKLEELASEHAKMEKHTNRWKRSDYLKSILDEHKNLNSNYQESSSETATTCSETISYHSTEDISTHKYFSAATNHTEKFSRSYNTIRSR